MDLTEYYNGINSKCINMIELDTCITRLMALGIIEGQIKLLCEYGGRCILYVEELLLKGESFGSVHQILESIKDKSNKEELFKEIVRLI